MTRTTRLAVLGLLLLVGCSSRQMYDAAQFWQRNECGKIKDDREYENCMQAASSRYETYQRELAERQGR